MGIFERPLFATNSKVGNGALQKGVVGGVEGKEWLKPRKTRLGVRYT